MIGVEEVNQVGTGTGFTEALFEGLTGFACAVGGGGGYSFSAGDFGDAKIGLKLQTSYLYCQMAQVS